MPWAGSLTWWSAEPIQAVATSPDPCSCSIHEPRQRGFFVPDRLPGAQDPGRQALTRSRFRVETLIRVAATVGSMATLVVLMTIPFSHPLPEGLHRPHQINPRSRYVDRDCDPLTISDRFNDEQKQAATQIWLPVLSRLQPILEQAEYLHCADTPNGLIIKGSAGWTLLLCCLPDQQAPHFILARTNSSTCASSLSAYLQDGGYRVEAHGEPDRVLNALLKSLMVCLGGRRLDHNGVSRRVGSPRRQTALADMKS